MTTLKNAMVALTAFVVLAVSAVSNADASQRYIILMNKHKISAGLDRAVSAAGGSIVRTLPQVGIAVAVSDNPTFADNMRASGGVRGVSSVAAESLPELAGEAPAALDAPTAADDLYNFGLVWGINRVNAPAAWAAGVTGSHDTVVAVIDTGIAWNHPDLGPNVVYADCFASVPCNPYPSQSDHGTHVAGTVAAAFGGGRVVGVAPNVGLAGYNTFEFIDGCGVCSFTDSRWAAEIDAADRGFDIISMSLGATAQLGGPGSFDLATFLAADKRVSTYVLNQGTAMVASAGNSGLDLNGTIVHIPGDQPGIINVGATGIQPEARYPWPGSFDIRAFYSNYGAPLTVAGPGGDCGEISTCNPATRPANWFEYLVLSTIVAANPVCAETHDCPVGYGWKGGTSMATPHVSGVAALVKDQNRDLSARQLANIIKRTAENLGDRQQFGHGMVDANAALD